jgi:hypothetical protein
MHWIVKAWGQVWGKFGIPCKRMFYVMQGALRIAHCGGFHSVLNTLVQAVNLVAKLLRHPIHWDTETIGCNPSLSSIAVLDQRTFKDALQEIADWLSLPQNADEFLVLYLDDQPDLLAWVGCRPSRKPRLLSRPSTSCSLAGNFRLQEVLQEFTTFWW